MASSFLAGAQRAILLEGNVVAGVRAFDVGVFLLCIFIAQFKRADTARLHCPSTIAMCIIMLDGGQILIALPAFILQGCTASW